MKVHEVFINDVLDTNVLYWSYNQGDNDFIDNAILIIPDEDRTKFLSSPNYNAANYLYKDVKIKNDYNEVGEYIAYRGRINAPPAWQEGVIYITIESYMAQYKDRLLGEYSTVEDIQFGDYTGYIYAFPTSTRIKDSGKSWGNDDYNNDYVLIHTPANIPSTEWFVGLDWLAEVIVNPIYASADDAHFNYSGNVWGNSTSHITIDDTFRGYLRFGINIPRGATITYTKLWYLKDSTDAVSMDLHLLDLDNCPAFPDGAGTEASYPIDDGTAGYPKKISWTDSAWGGWKELDITAHLQAFIDRTGYLPGQYMGLRVSSPTTSANFWDAFDVGVGEGGNPAKLEIGFTYTEPTDIDFIINDTIAPDTIQLTSFNIDGFIVGHPYSISSLTSDIVEYMIDNYSLDESVSKDIETSTIGLIKKFVWGNYPYDTMRACFQADNFRMRLKNDLEFMYRSTSTIANAGTIPEDIIEKKFRSNNPAGLMYNVVKMKDVYGRLVERSWNYTTHAPQDGDAPTALPAGYPQREIFLPAVRYGGTTVCKSICDTYLYLYAEPESEENITIELKHDLNFQPGQIVDIPYRGDTYSDYLVTRKSYNEATQRAMMRLVAT